MSKWIPLTLVAALALFSGCKKNEPAKTEAQAPAVDTSAALPAPPELEPVDEMFPDSTPATDTAAKTAAKPAAKPVATTPTTTAAKPVAQPAAQTSAKPSAKPAAKPVAKSATPAAPASSAGLSEKGAYTLQVGIFNNERLANRTADKLKAQGFPAYVTHVQDPKPSMPGTYYRVRVGSFLTSQAARAYGQTNLAPAGVDFWADLKGRDTQAVQAAQPTVKPKSTTAPSSPTPAPTPVAPDESKPAAAAPTPTPAATPAATSTPTPVAPAQPAPAKQDTKPAASLPDW